MRNILSSPFSRRIGVALAAAGFTLASAPTFAQTVEELTVTGRWGPYGEPRSLSQAVSYADLDLTIPADQDVLKRRINDTARSLCAELGESGTSAGPIPSCQKAARDDAMKQARTAIAMAVPRNAYAAAPPYDATAMGSDAAAVVYDAVPPAPAPAPVVTTRTITNGPVPDTPENRARFGGPMSRGGAMTAPAGD